MNKFLLKLLIKDSENIEDVSVRKKYGSLSGILGIFSNVLLALTKILIGILSSSVAIVADGINNFADAASSIMTFIGFRLAALPEDEEHPYGHQRIEYLTGLFISIFIIIVGVFVLKDSIEKIKNPEAINPTLLTYVVLILSILIKIWQRSFYMTCYSIISSVTLKAAAIDSRNDAISTFIILFGSLFTVYSNLNLDGYLGLLVALFIIWSGISLIRETSSPLLGEKPDSDLVQSIIELATNDSCVLGIHDIVVHNYGPGRVFATAHIELDSQTNFLEGHDLIDTVEKEISETLSIHFVAHMDPVIKNDPTIDILLPILKKGVQNIEGILSFHDLRVVPTTAHTNIIFDLVLSPSCPISQEEIIRYFRKILEEENPTFHPIITFDQHFL